MNNRYLITTLVVLGLELISMIMFSNPFHDSILWLIIVVLMFERLGYTTADWLPFWKQRQNNNPPRRIQNPTNPNDNNTRGNNNNLYL